MSALLAVLDVEFGVDVIGVIVIAPIVTADVLLILLTAEIAERCFLLKVLLFKLSSASSILRLPILISLLLPSACCFSICLS